MSEKILLPAEAIALLARRRSRGIAQRRRARAGDASDAANIRSSGNLSGLVLGHKFRIGEAVTLLPSHYGANRRGRFAVTCLLPQDHGINQYRLKSTTDGHERIANENELI